MAAPARPHAEPAADELLAFLQRQAPGHYELQPLAGGANNRVFRVPRPDGDWVLKCYFQNPGDPRDRFGAEHAFYDWIWSRGIRRTPEPVAWDPQLRLGLFSYVPGRKLLPAEVTEPMVRAALDFLLEVNAGRALPAGARLSEASEACFSLAEHLACVDRRIARLQRIEGEGELDREARSFVQTELTPAWQHLRAQLAQNTTAETPAARGKADPLRWCLSPSDFGFHNALLRSDGALRFFDFEYAGWDDPAKTICDFFCQPELSVPATLWDNFSAEFACGLGADANLPARARRLWPAYKLKWCCILLNEFVLVEKSRRAFAAGSEVSSERRARQISKARQALAEARALQ